MKSEPVKKAAPNPATTPAGAPALVPLGTPRPVAGKKVALFVTCLTDQFYPHVGIAVTKVLEHFGCDVHFPDAQTCCGQPFYNNGFEDEARSLARRMTGIFADYDYVVTPSGSCCAMVREHFHHLLKDDPDWSAPVERLCARTFEFVEFLDQVLKVNLASLKLPQPTTLTYHYTCHLRGIGIKDEGVRLLRQLGNVDFKAMEKTDQCCGFGGTFAIKYPAISGAIVQDKVNCISATGASTTICNDAGCTMNISGMCHRHGVNTTVRHIAELLAEALSLDIKSW